MQGFAGGLLAGFNTVDQALTNRKNMELREAYLADQQRNADRNYELIKDKYQRENEYSLRQAEAADNRWEKQFNATQQHRQTQQGIAQAQLHMQREQHDATMDSMKFQRLMKENEPLISGFINSYDARDVQAMGDYAKKIDPQIARLVPGLEIWNDENRAFRSYEAAKNLYQSIRQGALPRQPDEVARRVNANMDSIGILFQDEADRAVGLTDPETGQRVVSARVHHVEPVENPKQPGGYLDDKAALFLEVTYPDGSSAIKPVTDARSSDPNDPIKHISVSETLTGGLTRGDIGFMRMSYSMPQKPPQPELSLAKAQEIAAQQAGKMTEQGEDFQSRYAEVLNALRPESGAAGAAEQMRVKRTGEQLLKDPEIAKNPDAVLAVNTWMGDGRLDMLSLGKEEILKVAGKLTFERKKKEKREQDKNNAAVLELINNDSRVLNTD